MEEWRAEQIVIRGLVQGIGYRPFVAELAEAYQITGWVKNTAGIVTILAEGRACRLEQFLSALLEKSPPGARVDELKRHSVRPSHMERFQIKASEARTEEKEIPLIPPDLPTCEICEKQLRNPADRRYRYPFISCTACGPRYSILERLPYDRDTITMKEFALCPDCAKEYRLPGDIRRHAQTIACPVCGPVLRYQSLDGELPAEGEMALFQAAELLASGGIVAVKDIGGYHLAGSPFREETASSLRLIKGREKKPFAVLFKDVEAVRRYCLLNKQEEEQLRSPARPIVLLKNKRLALGEGEAETQEFPAFAENVCGSSPDIGAMLPGNPLQILLTEKLGPLIMTSANRSGELMITDNLRMLEWMREAQKCLGNNTGIRLGVLSHTRRIVTPLDDSVVRITAGRRQIFRRARGMVPEPVRIPAGVSVFAAGGDLKSCFCFAEGNRAYLSQHLGDLEEEESLRMYQREKERMRELFGFEPKQEAADLHPAYRSVGLVGGNALRIQHHHAHAASVLAEHGLTGSVLCFTFDGTGYGTDGSIWGSECFLWDQEKMDRLASLKPVRLLGGNEGARRGDSMLYGYFASFGEAFHTYLEAHWDSLPWLSRENADLVETALVSGINGVESSSMGRLFDAVSALLDICHYNSYEGEAAIELEYLAAGTGRGYPLHIEIEEQNFRHVGNLEPLFFDIVKAVVSGVPREELARGFILAAAEFVCGVSSRLASEIWNQGEQGQIALSGGTFQNRILLEETIRRLEEAGFLVSINEQVPPGDGGICLGQAYLAGLAAAEKPER